MKAYIRRAPGGARLQARVPGRRRAPRASTIAGCARLLCAPPLFFFAGPVRPG
ncbi:hypothetical protein L538_0749 [Bordetella hinzii 4161]|nr:hypothetical protein L538_0749 [Bordetella hinzii 4161]